MRKFRITSRAQLAYHGDGFFDNPGLEMYMQRILITLSVLVASLHAVLQPAHSAENAIDELRSCQACHGVVGVSVSGDIPNLAGQKKAYLIAQLQAFKSGARKSDLMTVIASQLDASRFEPLAEYWSRLPAAGADNAQLDTPAARTSPMEFPSGFPAGFAEYHREDNAPDKMVNVYYANDVALTAARSGKPLPQGSALIVGFFSVKQDPAGKPLLDADQHLMADQAMYYSGMQSQAGWGDSVQALLRNGDWRYALFDAHGARRDGQNYAVCLACHKPAADRSYVFTWDALKRSPKAD